MRARGFSYSAYSDVAWPLFFPFFPVPLTLVFSLHYLNTTPKQPESKSGRQIPSLDPAANPPPFTKCPRTRHVLPYLQFNELDKLSKLLAEFGKSRSHRLQSAVCNRQWLPIIDECQQTAPLTRKLLATALYMTGSGCQG